MFRASVTVANVMVTLTVTAGIIFTDARCICGRRIMSIPGHVTVEVRRVTEAERSGRGRVVSCRRCSSLVEVIEHL
jgi:hypothetical protein